MDFFRYLTRRVRHRPCPQLRSPHPLPQDTRPTTRRLRCQWRCPRENVRGEIVHRPFPSIYFNATILLCTLTRTRSRPQTLAAMVGGPMREGGVNVDALSVNRAARMPQEVAGGPMPSYAANLPMSTSMMLGMLASDQDLSHVEVICATRLGRRDGSAARISCWGRVRAGVGRPASIVPGTLPPGCAAGRDLYFDIPLEQEDPSGYWASSEDSQCRSRSWWARGLSGRTGRPAGMGPSNRAARRWRPLDRSRGQGREGRG